MGSTVLLEKGGTYRQRSHELHPTAGATATGLRYGNVTTKATVMWQTCKAPRFRGALRFWGWNSKDKPRLPAAAIPSERGTAVVLLSQPVSLLRKHLYDAHASAPVGTTHDRCVSARLQRDQDR